VDIGHLGMHGDAKARRMLLVLSRGADAAGVVIDGLPERLRWSDDGAAALDAAPPRLAPHLCGACLIDERLWFDLDCDALLAALEHALKAAH
jgi:purine-binding chemotaxis protein CheW